MTDTSRHWCYEELMANSVIYGACYDFEPVDAYLNEDRAWTLDGKWFSSLVALKDMEYMTCPN